MPDLYETSDSITVPTWVKYSVLSNHISSLDAKSRRKLFLRLRNCEQATPDVFFPEYGFTFGEFAVLYILSEHRKNASLGEKKNKMQ